jgi:hypothetical protein
MMGRREMHTKLCSENLKKRNHLGHGRLKKRIKKNFKEIGLRVWTAFVWLRAG